MTNFVTLQRLLLIAVLGLAGCSSFLPRGSSVVEGPWGSYEEAQQAFDQIIPYRTTAGDLKVLRLDPHANPNILILNYSDVLRRFVPSPSINADDLDAGVKECINAKAVCRGLEIDQRSIRRTRIGNFWADFLNFKRQTDVTGWRFNGVLLLKGEVVVYKLVGGQPIIHEMEQNRNPLGPLQGVGEAELRRRF